MKYEVNNRVTTAPTKDSKYNIELIEHMLQHNQYRPLKKYLNGDTSNKNTYLLNSIQLAQAIIDVNIPEIEKLAPKVNRHYLLKPTFLRRRVYSYMHYMTIQYQRQEYMDYVRGLSPLLVDLLRLLIEHDFMPDLNEFIKPVIKENADGKPIYRGLQWQQSIVESEPNLVAQTFTKYYGNRFNYDHYVSSSHLLKIIDDYCQNDEIKAKTQSLRHIEKYIRNLVAHEIIYVNDELVERRTGMTVSQIHHLLKESLLLAGLDDKRQWEILNELNKTIKNTILEMY